MARTKTGDARRLVALAPMAIVAIVAMTVLPAGALGADERILRKEAVVDAGLGAVWKAWTTVEGLRFVSGKSRVELRVGGPYEWFLDGPADERGKRGGEGAQILAWLPHEMLAFTWTFPPDVPTLRNAGETTQIVVLFEERDDGKVLVRFAQHGWQGGDDWDAGYAYFERAWDFVLQQLQKKVGGN